MYSESNYKARLDMHSVTLAESASESVLVRVFIAQILVVLVMKA